MRYVVYDLNTGEVLRWGHAPDTDTVLLQPKEGEGALEVSPFANLKGATVVGGALQEFNPQ